MSSAVEKHHRLEMDKPTGLFSVLTNTCWWTFTHGPVEWQGERIIGTPHVVQAWKLPGDLFNLENETYVKVLQVTKDATIFHPAGYKEILHTSWGGWSPTEFTFRVGTWEFKRGIFAEKHGSCGALLPSLGLCPWSFSEARMFASVPCLVWLTVQFRPRVRRYAMVLHFERLLVGHTGANIMMIYHPVVPVELMSVALRSRRNLDAQ